MALQLRFQPQVVIPPAALVDRFIEPISKAYLTWWVLAHFVPIEITSWWRSDAANAIANGQRSSQHLVGTAIDGLSPGMSRAQLLPLVQTVARFTGVSVPSKASATSGRSVHVQALPFGQVAEILRRDPGLVERLAGIAGPPRPLSI